MGEMADFCLEQVEEFEDRRFLFRIGEITEQEAFEEGIIDELGYEISPGSSQPKTCRCCGKAGLHWGLRDGKWRLFDNRGMHRCPKNPLNEKARK